MGKIENTSLKIYAHGPITISVCAPEGMTAEQVTEEVNRLSECGTENGWQVSDEKFFRTGEDNPHSPKGCAGTKHWLFTA